jgi:tripartite-type tricarboxylate transporter receptor subunit TctC
MPRNIIDRLHDETVKALQAPKVRDKLTALAVDRLDMTPGEFAAYVQREIALNRTLVQKAGIKPD